jgi:hypothetical protein
MRIGCRGIPAGAAILTTMSLFSLSAPTALADDGSTLNAPKLTMQQAEQIAESTLQIPANFTLQSESYSTNNGDPGSQTYFFSFSESDTKQPNDWISVSVDANTGRIVNFNRPPSDTHFVFPVPTSLSEAKAIAEEWAQKLYPDEYKQVTELPLAAQVGSLTGPTSYTFNFERVVNGIPAPFDGFWITIDQRGHLTSVFEHWTDVAFPSPDKVIPKDKASALYSDKLDLHLVYRPVWKSDTKPSTELLYTQGSIPFSYWGTSFGNTSISNPVLDAQTGDAIDPSGAVVPSTPYQVPKVLDPNGPTLSGGFPKVNWDESKSLAFAKAAIGISDTDKLTNVNEWQDQLNGVSWNFSWKTADNSQINVNVNATYGIITNYSKYTIGPVNAGKGTPSASTSNPITQDQINQTVTNFARKLFPNATGSIAVYPTPGIQGNGGLQTSFQILPIVHGVPNEANQGNINVNPATGEIQDLWMSINQSQDETLPDPNSAISIDRAKEKWMQSRPLTLVYLMTQPMPGVGIYNGQGASDGNPSPKIVLAYAPMSTQNYSDTFNAVTGEFESPQTPVPYTGNIRDLDGVAAAPQIQLLVNRALVNVDANGDVHPNKALTNAEFVKLVVDALGQQYRYDPKMTAQSQAMKVLLARIPKDSPVYQEIAVAYQLGWLNPNEPFNPNDLVTRSQAAKILARALGYGPLLTIPEAFQTNAKDANAMAKDEFAAAALTSALGIFPLVDGNFNPHANVTLADAAVAVVQTANIFSQAVGVPYPGVMAETAG